MKIRLSISTGPNQTTTFEHAGPIIRIGKDPEFELSLNGEAARSVSFHHARIEFVDDGALLVDTESSNGTLLNNNPIKEPTPLRVRDRFRLGYTGPQITVVELEKAQPPAPPQLVLSPRLLYAGIGGLTLVVLLIAGGLWFRSPPGKSPDITQPGQGGTPVVENLQTPPGKAVTPTPPVVDKPNTTNPLTPPPVQATTEAPRTDIKEIGRHVSLAKWGPSLLLQRQGESYPWTAVRPEGPVFSSHSLVCLPGYRTMIALGREDVAKSRQSPAQDSWVESGVQLGLWGNVPEFSGFPPVLESVVMLNIPATEIDLDLILERGRIHVANRKAQGPIKVRLRFLREVWDLTLPNQESEVCAELWNPPQQATTDGPGKTPLFCLGLFTKGQVRIHAPKQQVDLAASSRVFWVSGGDSQIRQENLTELPLWWAKPPGSASTAAADVMLSLIDWQNILATSPDLLDKILTNVRESKDPTFRVLGLLFLSALNAQAYLADFLEDRQHSEVRGTAAHALRTWLGQNRNFSAELIRILKEHRGYAKDKAMCDCRVTSAIFPGGSGQAGNLSTPDPGVKSRKSGGARSRFLAPGKPGADRSQDNSV